MLAFLLAITIFAQDPAWTLDRFKSQYIEAQADVSFMRWIRDEPYTAVPFDKLELTVEEFHNRERDYRGAFTPTFLIGYPDKIEYSLEEELNGPLQVIRHELGHLVELQQERIYFETSGEYAHIGHGDAQDPFVLATNAIARWFYRGMRSDYVYWPGLIGR
jgi:hypothetical protein